MAHCSDCKYFRRGYRSGKESGYAWTAMDSAGTPLVFGRCECDPPRPMSTGDQPWWPPCHEDDYCGHWEAIA